MQNKRIFAISMVKNEADIIESFVRYNLNVVDAMIILDNGSTDDTLKILELLESEGLPIFIFEDKNREYDQANKMNQLLLRAVNEFKADIIVPLDADEFLMSSKRGNPRVTLEEIETSTFYKVKWKTYVPNFNENQNEMFIPAKITSARDESLEDFYKVILPANLVKEYSVRLTKGNHDLIYDKKYNSSINQVLNTNLRIAHFPIRSKEQATSKISVGWINILCEITRSKNESWHMEKMFNDLKESGRIEDGAAMNFAKRYALNKDNTSIKLKKDPIDLSYCKNITIKYTDKQINSLTNLLNNCEQLSLDYLNFKRKALAEEERLKTHVENLKKEKLVKEHQLKSEINKYKNSSSWIITSPLRKMSARIKNLKNS